VLACGQVPQDDVLGCKPSAQIRFFIVPHALLHFVSQQALCQNEKGHYAEHLALQQLERGCAKNLQASKNNPHDLARTPVKSTIPTVSKHSAAAAS
jgi:hypothetical protein